VAGQGRLLVMEAEVQACRDGDLIRVETAGVPIFWLTDEQAEALAWELNQEVAKKLVRQRREGLPHETG
jgi:hypothetical protein